jgi:predicted oxidoreductase
MDKKTSKHPSSDKTRKMTVKQLMEKLQQQDPDAEVSISVSFWLDDVPSDSDAIVGSSSLEHTSLTANSTSRGLTT